MDKPSASMHELARRLLEANRAAGANTDSSDQRIHDAILMTDRLRSALIKFAGLDGYTALLRRALALARSEVPALKIVKVNANGDLEGLLNPGTRAASAQSPDSRTRMNSEADAAIAITSHLLELLAVFVGEPLTLRLVRDTWPDASPDTPSNTRQD